MKPLFVAELNPYGSDPRYALYPYPENSAGGRLCFKVMGLTRREYLERFDRVNLCTGKWSIKEARERAVQIVKERVDAWVRETETSPLPPPSIVLLGSKVVEAFGLRDQDKPFAPFVIKRWNLLRLIILPHPSGLSRAWNEPGAYERARGVLREAGVL